jgi:predicted ATP-grasp superfamily ATP-dependent carboligase
VGTALLPAVVLGIDTPIGLTIIRELGMRGVPVVGIGRTSDALGMASRYLRHGLVRVDGDAALIGQLLALAGELGTACLFTVSETDIALLNQHRPRLVAAGYRLVFADQARMDRVLYKEQTYAAAVKVGVRVPRTVQIASMSEARALLGQLRYPVVLKWANPNEVVQTLSAAGCALDKTRYCYTHDALLTYLQQYEQVGIYPLIQEYCGGYGLGQFILMQDGVAHATFQHRRVHEWPPEGGFSSLCESLPVDAHPAQMARSIALLRELDWEGIAMVEYRHDPETGDFALMEINGRFWGSLPLAYHAGAAFPWLAYRLFGLREPVAQPSYRAGVRCRFMIPESKRLIRILFQNAKIADRSVAFARLPALLGYLADFLRPASTYYVFEWKDPAPFFRDIGTIARRLLPRR